MGNSYLSFPGRGGGGRGMGNANIPTEILRAYQNSSWGLFRASRCKIPEMVALILVELLGLDPVQERQDKRVQLRNISGPHRR